MSAKYLMQAVGADGVLSTWPSTIADWLAVGFLGTAPAVDVAILKAPAGAGGGGSGLPTPTTLGDVLLVGAGPAWIEGPVPVGETIASFATGRGLFRAGAASANPATFTASYGHLPSSVTVHDDQGNTTVAFGSTPFTAGSYAHAYTKTTAVNVTYTLTATDSLGSVATRTVTDGWGFDVYHGQAATCTTAANIQALPHSILAQSRVIGNFAAESTGGNYDWYACPTSFGTPTFTDVTTGFPIPFSKTTAAINVTNGNGITVTYDIWRSDNPAIGTLGTAVIKVT